MKTLALCVVSLIGLVWFLHRVWRDSKVRKAAKAYWLAFKCWQTTREIRALSQRYKEAR